jgi:3',5'-cyclic AMP phosphodiesterase CpdA
MGLRKDAEYVDDEGKVRTDLVSRLDKSSANATFQLRVFGPPPSPKEDVVVLSFVQVSDVQLRDWGVFYESPSMERVLDKVVPSVIRPEALETRDELPFLALVNAINATLRADNGPGSLPRAERPSFLIHTGDAVDSSVVGEVVQFVNVANRLKIPWLNTVGNHDVFVMGNFPQRGLRTADYDPALRFVVSRTAFRNLHEYMGSQFAGSVDSRLQCHAESEAGTLVVPPTSAHGLDLSTSPGVGLSYSVGVNRGGPLPFRLVVLDTVADDKDTYLAKGDWFRMPGPGALARRLTDDQFGWLRKQIERGSSLSGFPEEFVLVFAHHTLTSGAGDLKYDPSGGGAPQRLRDYLAARENVLAVFDGHTHVPAIHRYDRPGASAKLLEVTAPSMHEYPQLGYLVNVLWRRPTKQLVVSVRAIRGVATGSGSIVENLETACEKARSDADREQRKTRLSAGCNGVEGAVGEPLASETVVASDVECPSCGAPVAARAARVLVIERSPLSYGGQRENVEQLRDLFAPRTDLSVEVATVPASCDLEPVLARYRERPPDAVVIHRGAFDESGCGGEQRLGAVLSDLADASKAPLPVVMYSRLMNLPVEIREVTQRVYDQVRKQSKPKLRITGVPLRGDETTAHFDNPCNQARLLKELMARLEDPR